MRQTRTLKPSRNGIKRKTYAYPLNEITYCAHCEQLAIDNDDPSLRSTFGGTNTYGTLRYKHKRGVLCGVHNRSVRCEIYEDDFYRLLQLLEVKPEAVELMTELALYTNTGHSGSDNTKNAEVKKQEAIALAKRRLEASKFLFLEGDIDQDEYLHRKEQNEREIAHWQTFTTEKEQLALELTMCIETVERISSVWNSTTPEEIWYVAYLNMLFMT